ncbi:contractile injection system tape measure protein [Pseudomonas koreensis]|uniref:contractile injection system tape measure protein n=1 Tax=Pseudomonas koreensis TaxID=198620 RepID=UPI003F87B594
MTYLCGNVDMTSSANKLERLRCRLHANGVNAAHLQQQCSILVRQQLQEQLAEVLKQACSLFKGKLFIDRLVLQVASTTPAQFDTQFVPGVIQELEHQLALMLSSMTLPTLGQVLHVSQDGRAVVVSADNSMPSGAATLFDNQQTNRDSAVVEGVFLDDAMLLDEFLRTGYLREPGRWQQAGGADAWLLQVLGSPTPSLLAVLAHACLAVRSHQRLAQGFHPSTLYRLITVLVAGGRKLQILPGTEPVSLSLAALLYYQRHPQTNVPPLDMAIAQSLSDDLKRVVSGGLKLSLIEDESVDAHLREWVHAVRDIDHMEFLQAKPKREQLSGDQSRGDERALTTDGLSERVLQADALEMQVCNAGVVLLWPLLPRLFTECGWLQREEDIGRLMFVDDIARQSAVFLLDHLTWSAGPAEEWRCALNKWLCGVPFEQVLEPVPLPRDSLSAADRCLALLIAQLPGLSRCTVADVRAMFLQRPGLLTRTEKGWCLRVQTDASDILVLDMPWPMGEVRLPWMESALPIDWLSN